MTHADLQALFDAQYQASRAQVDVPLLVRRERLLRMRKLLDEHAPRWPLPCRPTSACVRSA